MRKRAVVLLSGGLDSSTTLFLAKEKGYECHALICDYGQRHKREIDSARSIARIAKVQAHVVRFRLPHDASSLLRKGSTIKSPDDPARIGKTIPDTYVPGRNTILLALAASLAESLSAEAIFIGANAVDYSGYPDCRPKYILAFNRLIRLGTKRGVLNKAMAVYAPLIRKTKAQIIMLGRRLRVPYGLTWSCYEGKAKPCGRCESCVLRAKGFIQAGGPDPLFTKTKTSGGYGKG